MFPRRLRLQLLDLRAHVPHAPRLTSAAVEY